MSDDLDDYINEHEPVPFSKLLEAVGRAQAAEALLAEAVEAFTFIRDQRPSGNIARQYAIAFLARVGSVTPEKPVQGAEED